MKIKFFIMIFILLALCGCSINNMSEKDIIYLFIESTFVEGDFKQSLELSTGFDKDKLEAFYQEVESGYRELYNKVDIHLASDDDHYVAFLQGYRILVEIGLTKENEMQVNDVTAYRPSIEELEEVWISHDWETKTVIPNKEESS